MNTTDDMMVSNRPPFSAVQRRHLVEQVIQQIQEQICLNKLEVGVKLPPEPELMVKFGVGRSTIREAVRALVHAGFLEVRQGDGTYVRARSVEAEPLAQRLRRSAVLEVYEVRRILELEIARLAAHHRDEADLAQMRTCLDKRLAAQQAGDVAAYLDADISFHIAVAAASKNSVLADLYQTFSTALRDALTKLIAEPVPGEDQAPLHERLFNAIVRGDGAEAQRWTAEYLDSTMQRLHKLLG